jgi:hypothetical protein
MEVVVSDNPRSLEALLRVCKVDMSIWEVDTYRVNKWEVALKIKEQIIQQPLYQVKANLIRILPIKTEFPHLVPLSTSIKVYKVLKPTKSRSLYKSLIIPDSQNGYYRDMQSGEMLPFHDRRAWDVALQVAKEIRPDTIILLGDMLDLPDWTDKFLKSPEVYFTTQPALNELNWWIAQLATTGAEIHYIEGNHEYRLTRGVITNIVAAYKIRPANMPDVPPSLSVENLLGLPGLKVIYHGPYPDGEYWINDNLRVSHGAVVRQGPGDTVKAILAEARNSEIVGHIHRHEMAHKTVHPRTGPITYVAYSPGTICNISSLRTLPPGKSKRNNWQQGLGIVDYEEGNGLFQIHPHSINEGRLLIGNKIISADKQVDSRVAEAISLI